MIRKATKNDFERIFKLTMKASKLVFEDALNTKDEKKMKDLAFKFFNSQNTKFSFNNTYVFEINHIIAGCIIFYDSSKEKFYNQTMENYLQNNYKFPIEALENTVYIDSIAVFEEFRGQKIATKLISYVTKQTKQNISLITEDHKNNVTEYYKRLGFKIVKKSNLFNSKVNFMLFEKQIKNYL